ncbi:MAG: DUF4157 domain-containing protein [Methanosarcinales archaeon]|nr:DUF4157 domain-containing protein [Methanosarcinales archaeon]
MRPPQPNTATDCARVLRTGQYTSGTGEGQRVMAHELTHVVQQSGKK